MDGTSAALRWSKYAHGNDRGRHYNKANAVANALMDAVPACLEAGVTRVDVVTGAILELVDSLERDYAAREYEARRGERQAMAVQIRGLVEKAAKENPIK